MDETIVIKIQVKLNALLGTLVRIGSVTESRDLREIESNSCVFCNRRVWMVIKSQGQLRLRQIKGLVNAMEIFAGTARKRLQVSPIPSQCTHGQTLATFPLTQCMLSK